MSRYRDRPDLSGSGPDKAEVRQRTLIYALLILQVVIFLTSVEWSQISLLCTLSTSKQWGWIAYIHGMFLALLLLGLISFIWPRLRLWYVVLLCLGLAVLPLQARLVEQGVLFCDGP